MTPTQLDYHERWKSARSRIVEAGRRFAESKTRVPVPNNPVRNSVNNSPIELTQGEAILVEPYRQDIEISILPKRVGFKLILRAVSQHYKISPCDLTSHRRTRDLVTARHVLYYLLKTLTPKSLPEIGRLCGGKDHTTILHGVRKITAKRLDHPGLDADLRWLEALLAPQK